MVLTFETVNEILSRETRLKATERYFPAVMFITLYKVVLTFELNFPVVLFIVLCKVVLT